MNDETSKMDLILLAAFVVWIQFIFSYKLTTATTTNDTINNYNNNNDNNDTSITTTTIINNSNNDNLYQGRKELGFTSLSTA